MCFVQCLQLQLLASDSSDSEFVSFDLGIAGVWRGLGVSVWGPGFGVRGSEL